MILLTAARRHGMRFNPRISAFEDDDDTEAHLLGPGFSLKQLAFAEQAYSARDPTELIPVVSGFPHA